MRTHFAAVSRLQVCNARMRAYGLVIPSHPTSVSLGHHLKKCKIESKSLSFIFIADSC